MIETTSIVLEAMLEIKVIETEFYVFVTSSLSWRVHVIIVIRPGRDLKIIINMLL